MSKFQEEVAIVSKRELFAAMAMQGMLASAPRVNLTTRQIVTSAVSLADALLEELERPGGL